MHQSLAHLRQKLLEMTIRLLAKEMALSALNRLADHRPRELPTVSRRTSVESIGRKMAAALGL